MLCVLAGRLYRTDGSLHSYLVALACSVDRPFARRDSISSPRSLLVRFGFRGLLPRLGQVYARKGPGRRAPKS
jgi:hypothetical protein